MIVDSCTHIWTSPDQLGQGSEAYARRWGGPIEIQASPAAHAEASRCVSRSLVLAFRSAMLQAEVPNDVVAEYVARDGQGRIGVAAVDPTQRGAAADAEACLDRSEFRGLTLSPSAQGFHPTDTRAMAIYELAARRGVPIFLCPGPGFPMLGRLEYARPSLLEEVAGEFPNLKMVLWGMGWPYVEECVGMLGKHPCLFASVAGLVGRPWVAYNALVLAHEFGVADKILMASGFPSLTPASAIEGMYRIQELTAGTNLPIVPRETLRSIVERDSLTALGIARAGEVPPARSGQDEDEIEQSGSR
jgi:predicted TIM-barrel fold metal-dependent hydrolase